MIDRFDQITPESMGRLTQGAVDDPAGVEDLFRRLSSGSVELHGGISRNHEQRRASIVDVSNDRVRLRLTNFDTKGAQLFFNFHLDGHEYFFAASPLYVSESDEVEIRLPEHIYRSERRDRYRDSAPKNGSSLQVALTANDGRRFDGRIVNQSPTGIGIELPAADGRDLPADLRVQTTAEGIPGDSYARVRHKTEASDGSGWFRVGLSLSGVTPGEQIPIDRRDAIIKQSPASRAWQRAEFVAAAARSASVRAARSLGIERDPKQNIQLVDYPNDRGETIRAIVDTFGDTSGAPAVVIPPAWGRTKETLLPLAATILETFRRAGQPVTVIRFDGTHRRGESHIDSECRAPGEEYQHFTFSQAVRDIQSTIRFLDATPRFEPSTVVLATFSLAAIEGRRAVSLDSGSRIAGWVCAVGMVDLQSALRTISGGIDFGYGLQRGVRFGRHELVGVVADMDHTGLDALEHRLVYLEDAKRDLAEIKVPITWIHGRYDGWMKIEKVREALSCGEIGNRKLIEVPTGHQLRTSRQALSTFQLIAGEVGRMALRRPVVPRTPPLRALSLRQKAERARLPKVNANVRGFWCDYLLGRDRRVGMQLLTATAAYRNLMETQIRLLGLVGRQVVADLGAGTGEFPLSLARRPSGSVSVRVDEVDFVPEALHRGAFRLAAHSGKGLAVNRIVADLDGGFGHIPLADCAYDAVLASLVVSYLSEPSVFLEAAYRILKPGGRFVVSSLRRDADISKLYVDGIAELQASSVRELLGDEGCQHFDDLARDFLNDASKILDLEERGRFQFWDPSEFKTLVASAGFKVDEVELEFGMPPQAVVVSARRP